MWKFSYENECIDKTEITSYVLKQGSPDMSCVVMTTCNRKNRLAIVHVRQERIISYIAWFQNSELRHRRNQPYLKYIPRLLGWSQAQTCATVSQDIQLFHSCHNSNFSKRRASASVEQLKNTWLAFNSQKQVESLSITSLKCILLKKILIGQYKNTAGVAETFEEHF